MENMQPMLNIAEIAALEAGKIIMQHADRLDRVKIQAKGYNDLVTDVDTKSQQAIVDTILKAYPTHHILAEEDKNKLAHMTQYAMIKIFYGLLTHLMAPLILPMVSQFIMSRLHYNIAVNYKLLLFMIQ